MKAYVTSLGETTTDLCVWSLERLGFDVVLLNDPNTILWEKLKEIYSIQNDDFLRVDADVVCNKNVLELIKLRDLVWYQSLTYDWFKQDITHGGIQFVRQPAIQTIRNHIYEAKWKDRPESYIFRLKEFENPRICGTLQTICGLHGYKQNDVDRVKAVKKRRNQYENYDWELSERISEL